MVCPCHQQSHDDDTQPATSQSSQSSSSVTTAAALDHSYVTAAGNVTSVTSTQIQYELVGIVVHSGQANAGHYYSFIKDRR